MIPPYLGSNTRARDRVQALQAYYQQQQPGNSPAMRAPLIPSARRPGSHRVISQVGPVASSSDQNGGFYFFPPGTSGRNFQEAENPPSSRFHAWERDHLPPFSHSQVDRDSSSSWGAFHLHQVASGSDPGLRPSSLRRRHGSERTWHCHKISCGLLSCPLLVMKNYHHYWLKTQNYVCLRNDI